MKLFALLLALTLGASRAACPGGCSGHGDCGLGEICLCQPRWLGADCGSRECPYGLSWTTSKETAGNPGGASYSNLPSYNQAFPGDVAFFGAGGRHGYAECSNKGACNRASGECECFAGYAGKGCRKMKCPEDCSGNGQCMTNVEINPQYKDVNPDSQLWDWNKAAKCKCDPGYGGLACEKRSCPMGDDPLTGCSSDAEVSDIQQLLFKTTSVAGYFSLTFTDPMGGNYTTRPIFSNLQTSGISAATETATAKNIADALTSLPNFVIPTVTVTSKWASGASESKFDITFIDPANAGLQNLLVSSYLNVGANDQPASSPRFPSPTVATAATAATISSDDFRTAIATHKAMEYYLPTNGFKVKDSTTCSNRGDCDTTSGICNCWEGFIGQACATQTVFF